MHFLEVLTTEEHSKHKILAELRGGSRLSKKMLNAGGVYLLAKIFEVSQNAFGSCKRRETGWGQDWHKETAVALSVN